MHARSLRQIVAGVAIVAASQVAAAATLFSDDFSSYSAFSGSTGTVVTGTSSGAAYNLTNGSAFALSSTGGIGGSAAISVSGTTDNSMTNKTSFSLAAGEALNLSLLFQKAPGMNFATPQIGILPANTTTMSATGNNDLSFRISGTGTATQATGQLQLRHNNATPTGGAGSNVTLTTNNWYQIVLTVEKLATANQFKLSGVVKNVDASTGAVGTTVGSIDPLTITNATVYGDSSLFAAVRAQGNGVAYFDNFNASVVPEPVAVSMLGVAALAGLPRRRRA